MSFPASSKITRFTCATTRSTALALALPESSMLDTGLARRGVVDTDAGSGRDQLEPMGGTKQMAEGVVSVSWSSRGTRTTAGVRAGSSQGDDEGTERTDNSASGIPLCSPIPPSATTSPSTSPSPDPTPPRPRDFGPGSDPRLLDAAPCTGDPGMVMLADTDERRECVEEAPVVIVSSRTDALDILRDSVSVCVLDVRLDLESIKGLPRVCHALDHQLLM